MLTSKAVIQKIDARTSSVRLYQNFDLHSSWSFETHQTLSGGETNPGIFPFVFHGPDRFSEGQAGRETKVQVAADGQLLFADDYGVPGGFVVGVLFPEEYVPEVFKFKSKPFIPTGAGIGGASMRPPGHFEVFFNAAARLSAVVFLINQPTYFGFKCIARRRSANFPVGGEQPFLNDLYATLGFAETHPIQVKAEDLASFHDHFLESADLNTLAQTITRLSELARSGSYSNVAEAQTLSRTLQDALSTTASAVQLSDSYLTGGTVAAIVARLIAYFAL
jgi:hypothetical protein